MHTACGSQTAGPEARVRPQIGVSAECLHFTFGEWVILRGRFASLTFLKRLENVAELDLYSLVAE